MPRLRSPETMTGRRPSLDAAYGLDGPEANRRLYRDWAETYDAEFAEAHAYLLPEAVADAFAAAGGRGPVLDLGAGTGLVGVALARHGIGPVDGTDLSAEMLAVAATKGAYRRLFEGDLTARLEVGDGACAGVVSAGTFTNGHVGPEALGEVVRLLAPGGLACLSVNARHYVARGFAAALDALDGLRLRSATETPIYRAGAAPEGHEGDTALLLLLDRVDGG